MKEIPAFDVGVGVVGILDLHTDFCVPFRGSCMSNGARQTLDCDGIVISFSGNLYVLPKLARLTGVDASDFASAAWRPLRQEHRGLSRLLARAGRRKPILGPYLV